MLARAPHPSMMNTPATARIPRGLGLSRLLMCAPSRHGTRSYLRRQSETVITQAIKWTLIQRQEKVPLKGISGSPFSPFDDKPFSLQLVQETVRAVLQNQVGYRLLQLPPCRCHRTRGKRG